ncbi:T9SS type A sorting domain-containing protein [Flavobacterium sp. N1994]|uniref:T9SS type A sorting domain-containing protein n=1 Tax=Flavobacterium sp. N1994 TaxID=2986827 RepID=UPI002222CF57|nr:T9SS type A sorting domain-containing protein [Flavobacterium sp. N1994]
MKKITFLTFLLVSTIGFAQPTNNAPAPTKNAADVISVFSDTYSNVATNYNPNWGQSGICCVNPAYNPGTGNLVLAYTNFNYQGTEVTTQNAAGMEYLHVDVWTNANPASTTLQVSPINNGTGTTETLVTINYTQGSWYSVDIPKSAFTGMTWNSVFQMKFAANGPGSTVPVDIYLDNIYFWKTPIAAGADATLSDLKLDGVTVTGFNSAITTYNVDLPSGSTTFPQITSATTTDVNATRVITQASSLPGDATVVVTSQNTSVTKTYTVHFAAVGPPTAAPTPPTRPAADVKSIFSDAYTCVSPSMGYTGDDNTYNNSWCPGNTTLVQVAGDNTNKITGLGCEGITFLAGRFSAAGFTRFHMDIYTDTPTQDKSFNFKFSNWSGGAGETNAFEYSATNANILPSTNPGTWISIDLPLTSFNAIGGNNNTDFVQFVITSDLGTVYYDNIYLHKNTLGTTSFEAANVKLYPNPASNVLNIESVLNIDKVAIYNLLGQEVISQNTSSQTVALDVTNLQLGVYIVKTTIAGNVSSTRFIKE